ncbi:MAG: MFS transporter [Clostridia bacterium]|nr:MFS transporter [Clostridia bacterium]
MNNRKIKINLLLVSLVIIISVLALTGLITANVFEQKYTQNTVFPKVIKGQKLVSNIENALKYGKQLDNFFGMEDTLQSWLKQQNQTESDVPIEKVSIVLKDQQIKYGFNAGETLAPELWQANNFTSEDEILFSHQKFSDYHHILLPIYDANKTWVGSLDVIFSDGELQKNINDFLNLLKRYLIYTIAVISLILAVYVFAARHFDNQGNLKKRKLIAAFILILGLAQIIYGSASIQLLRGTYLDISHNTAYEIAHTINYDFQKIVEKGVPYDYFIDQVDTYMEEILEMAPLLEGIQFGGKYYSRDGSTPQTIDKGYSYNVVLSPDVEGNEPILVSYISPDYLKEGIKEIIIEMGTILVIAFFIMVEVVLFAGVYLSKKAREEQEQKEQVSTSEDDSLILRMVSFILAIVCYISVSFIPTVMNELYKPIPGVSTELFLGLPISIVFFTGAIFTFLGGSWIDRYGWQKILYFSFICLFVASIMSGLVKDPFIFILARGIHGVGYALAFIALRSYAVGFAGEENQKEAISSINSGLYSGINTAAVLGAMAMEKIGYEKTFYLGAVLLVIPVLIMLFILPRPSLVPGQRPEKNVPLFKDINVFKNTRVLTFLILISAPMAISVLFVDYFVPTFALKNSITVSDVGRIVLLNGIFVAYVSPFLLRFLSRFDTKKALIISRCCTVLGYGAFALTGNLVGLFIAVSFLGLADGLGNVYETEYFLHLDAVQSMGRGQALGYLGTIRKLAQSAGPQVFALGLAFGAIKGISLILVISLGLTTLFALVGRKAQVKGVSGSGSITG